MKDEWKIVKCEEIAGNISERVDPLTTDLDVCVGLESVPGKIIPEFLPFFMQSDIFMDRAVVISEGSLSPTTKWKALAIQEFPLPPLERQKEIFEVLRKVERCIRLIILNVEAVSKLSLALEKYFLNTSCIKNRSFLTKLMDTYGSIINNHIQGKVYGF